MLRRPSRPLLACVAAVALTWAAPLSSSGADGRIATSAAEVTASVSTRTLRSNGERSLELFLHVNNEGEAQTVGIEVGGGEWPYQTFGGPLAFGAPSMQGPGAVRLGSAPVPAFLGSSCARGNPIDFTLLLVTVPAQTSTTVELPVTAIVPSLPGTDYTPRVLLNWDNPPAARRISVPPVRMTGPTGFTIRLKTRPAGTIRAGRRVAILGSTSPAVRHASVRVSVRRAPVDGTRTPGPAHLIGVVRTDGGGRFSVARWTPSAAGAYQVLARIAHPGGGLMHDSTCPIAVSVGPRRR